MDSNVDDKKVIGQEEAPKSQEEQEKSQAVADFSQPSDNSKLNMEVKVYSPFRDYFDGPAFSLSAENDTGPFDILPKHHNFISLLSPCEMVVRSVKDGDQKIKISGGIMHVKADKVIVFLDV